MINKEHLSPAFEEMINCGLTQEKANQEIGFALLQINSKESLQRANKDLLNNAVAQVAYTGLSLSHLKQEAVISDYNERKQKGAWFLPMYRGLLKVAIAENAIIGANTQIIFDGDEYEINAAAVKNPVRHIVKNFSSDRKPLVSYTVLTLPNGLQTVTLFYKDEYELVKPKGEKFSPHTNWGIEMWKKSNLKRALKTVSGNKDSKLDHLIQLDHLNYSVEPIQPSKEKKENKPNAKPVLTKTHKHYDYVVNHVAKTGSWDKVKETFEVSAELENFIEDFIANKMQEVNEAV